MRFKTFAAMTGSALLTGSAGIVGVAAPASAMGGGGGTHAVGAVYVASNAYSGNEILTFPRYANGSVGPVTAMTATGGLGSGPGQYAPIEDDPLGSQSSLIADPTGRFLFAVNAGSNTVSAFTVSASSGLNLVDTEPSGGSFPVSLTFFGNTLYVLNAVGNSVTGFTVNNADYLTPLETCALPALPTDGDPLNEFPATTTSSAQPVDTQTAGQVGFSPNGKLLVVTSKEGPVMNGFPFGNTSGPGRIDVYQVDPASRMLVNCGQPTTYTLPYNVDTTGLQHGQFPFSFTWSNQGDLLVTEVFGESSVPNSTFSNLSAVSSFAVANDGTLTPVGTVADTSPVPCWIVRSRNNIFVANFLGNDISGYQVAASGSLTPAGGVATPLAGGTFPIDMAISADGQFLYELAPGTATAQLFPFTVGPTGNLSPLTPVNDGLGANSGQAGIATVTFS
jgi:6-phosphogluconolactonase (cycloisomerase 2 family)